MSIYKGDKMVANLTLNAANKSLSNLNPEGQAILSGKADSDLTNLSSLGTSRLFYSPFSINQGTRDEDGNNSTLHLFNSIEAEGSQAEGDFEQPILTEDGNFSNPSPMAVRTVDATIYVNRTYATLYEVFNYDNTKPFRLQPSTSAKQDFFIDVALDNTNAVRPSAIEFGFNVNYSTYSPLSIEIRYATDLVDADTPNWKSTDVVINTKSAKKGTVFTADLSQVTFSGNEGYCKYLRFVIKPNSTYAILGNITIKGKVKSSFSSLLVCDPCTITTCDGRCYTDKNSFTLSTLYQPSGDYLVFKNVSSKEISLVPSNKFHIAKNSDQLVGETAIWNQPTLSNNGVWNTSSFAVTSDTPPYNIARVDTNNVYHAFDNDTSTSLYYYKSKLKTANIYTCTASTSLRVKSVTITTPKSYIPLGITIYGSNSSDLSVAGNWDIPDSFVYFHQESNWKKLGYLDMSKITLASGVNFSVVTIPTPSNEFYKYLRFEVLARSNGTAKIANIRINADEIISPIANHYWLNISEIPAQLFICNGTNFKVNNDFVYIGECSISNGAISSIKNALFNNGWNWNRAIPHVGLIKSKVSATTWYKIYSNGMCEQGGYLDNPVQGTTVPYHVELLTKPTLLQVTLFNSAKNIAISYPDSGANRGFKIDTLPATPASSLAWFALGELDPDNIQEIT